MLKTLFLAKFRIHLEILLLDRMHELFILGFRLATDPLLTRPADESIVKTHILERSKCLIVFSLNGVSIIIGI